MANILKRQSTPWHLWLVGVLALLWNGFGAFDFTMTFTRGAEYLRSVGMNEATVQYLGTMPSWLYAPWALGVWAGVLGSLGLLARKRWSVWAYALSLLGAVGSNIVTLAIFPPPSEAVPQGVGAYMHYVIIGIAVFLLLYAYWMKRRTVLI
ncbi:MAG: hypothetical protein ACRYFE_09375 [Janthinobacterium lividum]